MPWRALLEKMIRSGLFKRMISLFVFLQIRLAAELTEAAQLTNFALSNGDSPDDSNSSTPILSRGKQLLIESLIFWSVIKDRPYYHFNWHPDPSFKRGSQKKRKRGSETRSVIRGKAEVFDLERPLNGMVPLSGPAQKDFDEPSSSTSNEAAMRAKLEQMMLWKLEPIAWQPRRISQGGREDKWFWSSSLKNKHFWFWYVSWLT